MKSILEENERRKALLRETYDPMTGLGAHGKRIRVETPVSALPAAYVPETMLADPDYDRALTADAWLHLRCRHDFEFWAVRCARIYDKRTRAIVPFRLNRAQRRVLGILEKQRLAARPLRLIVLKARQWGCSTLIQLYMAWIQLCHRRNWNSLICAHVKDSAANIRGMYSLMLNTYPEEMYPLTEDEAEPVRPEFRPYERSQNVREIAGRGCRVTLASAENPDSMRGADISMAHLSEVAFWPATVKRSPEAFVQAICGSVTLEPYSLVVMESTANGVGNFFHTEWLRCLAGKGDKEAVFVPWHEIEIYSRPVTDPEDLWRGMDDYERNLWQSGLTLEQIAWYHSKRLGYSSDTLMHAEFPSDPVEAFANTGHNVFSNPAVEALREGCRQPLFEGEIDANGCPRPGGASKVYCEWSPPAAGMKYVVAMDVGGRSATADYSVIAVLSCGERPEVVAQWRGHIDHDLLVKQATAIAGRYNNALLVVESNTLETEAYDGSDPAAFVLQRAAGEYPNLYFRLSPGGPPRPGFHTNRATKTVIITGLIEAVRDGLYVERDARACDELSTYRLEPGGAYSAAPGRHDDIVMTRAIALHVIKTALPSSPSAVGPIMSSW